MLRETVQPEPLAPEVTVLPLPVPSVVRRCVLHGGPQVYTLTSRWLFVGRDVTKFVANGTTAQVVPTPGRLHIRSRHEPPRRHLKALAALGFTDVIYFNNQLIRLGRRPASDGHALHP